MLIYAPRLADVNAALKAVSLYRLDQDLPFAALAREMTGAGCPMNARTLIDLFLWAKAKERGESWARHRPRVRTQYNLVKFHAYLKDHRKRRVAMRRRRRDDAAVAVAADKA